MTTGRFAVWSLGRLLASILVCFLYGIQFTEGAADDVLLLFCQCPFGYYQASRFPVLLQFKPPCGEFESTPSPTLCGRWKTFGLKCVRCHPNCYGCDGPTDAHCDTCAKGFFNASYILSEATLQRQSEAKRLSFTENLNFFNEDEWLGEFASAEETEVKRRGPKGNRRQKRNVMDYDSGSDDRDVTSDVVTTNEPEEAVDDNPTKHDGEITTRVVEISDIIEDEELIPLSTATNEKEELIDGLLDVLNSPNTENYDDPINHQTRSKPDTDDSSDSGSGDVLIDDELRAQLSPPSNPPPTRHPPTPTNYWYPDTLHPMPVKRSGGSTHKNEFENVGLKTSPKPEPRTLPTPAALLKAPTTQYDPPLDLVSWIKNAWDTDTYTKPSLPLIPTTSIQTNPRHPYMEGTSETTTVRPESSTTYLQNRTIPTAGSTRRKTTASTVPPYVALSTNSKNNFTEQRHTSVRRRTRKTTAQPLVTEKTTATTTVKPIHPLSSRSTVRDVSYGTNVYSTTNNTESKSNATLTTDNGKYVTTVTDSIAPREVSHYFRCVPMCPDGTYKDLSASICQICDSKCRTCVGPTFMNCTSCAASAVQAAAALSNVMGHVLTVTCLSECPGNHFVYNGTCTPCHEYCDGCSGFGPAQCLTCRHQEASSKSKLESSPSTPPSVCIEKEVDPESPLELILPLAFVSFLVLVTAIICIRWNCRPSDLCCINPELCNKLKKKGESENFSALPKKMATTGKIRNEYTPSPPNGTCPKCHVNTTDDGYELPLHPSTGSTTNYAPASLHSASSSANHTMIKPRRNDPLPLTPLELDAIQRREKSSNLNVYKNIPSTSKAAQAAENGSAIDAIPSTSSQSEEDRRQSDSEHLVLTDTSYANSEGLYANC